MRFSGARRFGSKDIEAAVNRFCRSSARLADLHCIWFSDDGAYFIFLIFRRSIILSDWKTMKRRNVADEARRAQWLLDFF